MKNITGQITAEMIRDVMVGEDPLEVNTNSGLQIKTQKYVQNTFLQFQKHRYFHLRKTNEKFAFYDILNFGLPKIVQKSVLCPRKKMMRVLFVLTLHESNIVISLLKSSANLASHLAAILQDSMVNWKQFLLP